MPKGDSPVCVFMLTPQREGRLTLVLNVLADGQLIASRRLVTTAGREPGYAAVETLTPYKVIEMPLRTGAQPDRLPENIATDSIPGAPSAPADPRSDAPQTGKFSQIGLPPMPETVYPGATAAPYAKAPVEMARKKSKLPWIAVGAAAAAFALIVPSVLVSTRGTRVSSTDATNTDVGSAPQLNETITALSRQIKQNPANAELYLKRADAYKRMNNLAAAGKDVDKAIQLAPNHPTARRLRTEISQEQDRRRAATQAIPR
jgi:hypothetical protein